MSDTKTFSLAGTTSTYEGVQPADAAAQHVDGGRARRSRSKGKGKKKAGKKRSGSRRRSRSRSKSA